MKKNLLITITLVLTSLLMAGSAFAKKGYYYQLKIYHIKGKGQEARMDAYLEKAYLPALHRAGILGIGVFKPIAADTAEQQIYVLIPLHKFEQFAALESTLAVDKEYLTAGEDYLEAPYNETPYIRFENILLKAFKGMPQPRLPVLTGDRKDRVYELRSYESATESISLNKIGMFNDAEMAIFNKLNFNAVFYGQVIAGSHMPNLMYLTTFNNKADRDKHWADFGVDYKKISVLPQYQHNVSKNTQYYLYPTAYSDF